MNNNVEWASHELTKNPELVLPDDAVEIKMESLPPRIRKLLESNIENCLSSLPPIAPPIPITFYVANHGFGPYFATADYEGFVNGEQTRIKLLLTAVFN